MAILIALETVVLALLVLLVLGLLRSHAEILRRLHDLGHGLEDDSAPRHPARTRGVGREEFTVFPEVPSPGGDDDFPEARDIAGTGLADDAVTVRVTGVDHRTLVAFLSSTCLTCQRFWDAFRRPDRLGFATSTRVVIVTKDPTEESAARIADVAPDSVPVVMSSRAWDDYRVPGSPYFVLVDGPSGAVKGEGTGIDWPQVRGLLAQVADDEALAADLEARRVRKSRANDDRERRVDAELLAAGIRPGDPSLFAGQPEAVAPAEDDADADSGGGEPR
ncbi:MAG: hypothetical protein HYX34_16145 [Actinobacteria bacterium]|nr:hypothetical protein [Actinomycetota bacterium]